MIDLPHKRNFFACLRKLIVELRFARSGTLQLLRLKKRLKYNNLLVTFSKNKYQDMVAKILNHRKIQLAMVFPKDDDWDGDFYV